MNGRVLHFVFSSLNSFYEKTEIYQKMEREKLYNLHKPAFFIVALFAFKMDKIFSDQISTVRKLVAENFAFFENDYNKLYCVNCRAFHAASCGIFCFFCTKT